LTKIVNLTDDPTAKERKQDHIELAFQSQVAKDSLDKRFYYEPLLAPHPTADVLPAFSFLSKHLARACGEFGMGMGLGSCRSLLYDDEHLADFNVRHLIGDKLPLYANLGIAQLEQLIAKKELYRVRNLLEKLQADGLIIHVNPFQEWMQPEGDHFSIAPITTIQTVF